MRRFTAITALAFVSLAVGGCAGSSKPAPAAQAADERNSAVRLQAAIYEVLVAPEQVGRLDAAKLATVDFAQFPAEIGQARALYLVDQQVSLAGDRVMAGTDEPMVTGSRVTDRGQRTNSVQYNSVGATIEFKAQRTGAQELQVTSTVEMSTKTDSPVEVAEGVSSPVIRKTAMSLKGPVQVGKPSVLISADAASRNKDGKAVVYIARMVLGADAPGTN